MARRNPPVYTFPLPHYLPMGFQGCTNENILTNANRPQSFINLLDLPIKAALCSLYAMFQFNTCISFILVILLIRLTIRFTFNKGKGILYDMLTWGMVLPLFFLYLKAVISEQFLPSSCTLTVNVTQYILLVLLILQF